jgi:hypothetical protein
LLLWGLVVGKDNLIYLQQTGCDWIVLCAAMPVMLSHAAP